MASEDYSQLLEDYVMNGLPWPPPTIGGEWDISKIRAQVEAEKAARAELPALEIEIKALGVEIPWGGFPNATAAKAAVIAKRPTPPPAPAAPAAPAAPGAPTPTCPGDSHYDPAFMQCVARDSIGMPVQRGVPTCPSGYMFMFTNTCVAIPGAPAPAADPAATSAQQQAAAAAAAETAQKAVDTYTLSFTGLQRQLHQLQDTHDLMAQAHGLYSGVSDDLHYSINQLSSKTSDLQNEINITNRKVAAPTWWPWLDMFLNVLLVLVLLYALYVVVIKLMYVRPVVPQFQTPY